MSTVTIGQRVPVPRHRDDDYTAEAARERLEFLRARTGIALEHVSSYSFDPALVKGNVEQFVGVAQVPIGVAGPLLVDGEHAQGMFYARWRPRRGRWSRRTTGACGCSTRPAA